MSKSFVGKKVSLVGNRNFPTGSYLCIASGTHAEFPRKAGKAMVKAINAGQFAPKTAVPEGHVLAVTSYEGSHLVVAIPEDKYQKTIAVDFSNFG